MLILELVFCARTADVGQQEMGSDYEILVRSRPGSTQVIRVGNLEP